LFASDDVTAKS